MTQRTGFVLRVKPDRVDEYVRADREVWPEMLEALRAAGIRNYTIFGPRTIRSTCGCSSRSFGTSRPPRPRRAGLPRTTSGSSSSEARWVRVQAGGHRKAAA